MSIGSHLRGMAAVAAVCIATSASAQEWPRQSVHLVVPYAPGGAVDIMARVLSERLSQRWKQSVVVENRAGGAEVIAASYVARAKPDGYTLFLATEIGLETNAFLFSKLPYNPQTDFTPITRVIEGPLIYVVKSDNAIRSMPDLIAAARKNPGKLSYGSSGTGGSIHLATNWLAGVAGNVQFVHAPYKGSAPTMSDLLAGVIDFTAAPLSVVAPYVADGRMRAIATSGTKRIASLPDAPSFVDLGYKDAVSHFMFGIVGPANMPPELASRIAEDVGAVMRDKDFQARNVDPFGFTLAVETPAQFSVFLRNDRENQRARVKAANVQLD
jgi:tripartite-type tricarboxylate transporter receptor subunit TctC